MNVPIDEKTNRTIHQIVDDIGQPSKAAHTEPLWVDRTQTNVFSVPTTGNKTSFFTTGLDYFSDLIATCDKATSEIYIAGWQVNWDALLEPGVRLYDLLYRCAQRGVNIYVMPWNDTEPVQTYDDQTKAVLESINERVKNAGGKGQVHVALCESYASVNNAYFSHHQKQVVVDRKIAYVGGIDLAYGRMDDESYNLEADSLGRQVLNRYNPGIPPLQKIPKTSPFLVDPDLLSDPIDNFGLKNPFNHKDLISSNADIQKKHIANGGFQVAYAEASVNKVINSKKLAANTPQFTTLDAKRQPRMPWQDVHCKIEGPAVADLLRNFVYRWNTVAKQKLKLPPPTKDFKQAGRAQIQVLRSAPANHCATENKANNLKGPAKTQQDIHVAMKNLIAKARRFIYIENQFFVSDFGQIGGPQGELSPAAQYIKDGSKGIDDFTLGAVRTFSSGNREAIDRLPQNGILKALLQRLKEVIVDDVKKPKFHVYITLPVHPEGALDVPSIAVQVYYTMQTLAFGSHSLLNGIKRLIKARELKDKKDPNYLRVINDASNLEYEDIETEACYEYVTLLNLRNWAQLGAHYVTEQIYVHSKLMIVDDRFALLGSANINDRSLLGERDSELAVLIMDDDVKRADINGKGSNQPVRLFAHELRKQIWKKLFGIAGNVRPANDLQSAIDEPGHPDSWKKIRKQAEKNAALYEAAFLFIPRNKTKQITQDGEHKYASIIPTWDDQLPAPTDAAWIKGNLASPIPCQSQFWEKGRQTQAANQLAGIKGFVTALPIEWTKNENIRVEYPTALIVENERKPDFLDPAFISKEEVAAILNRTPPTDKQT